MSPQPAPSAPGAAAPKRRKPRLFWWMIAAAAALAAVGFYAWESRTLPIQAIVVRPLSSDGAPSWLAGAITEEIADALRAVTKPSADPMFTAVLDGTVSRSGDRVRITARLTRADGHHYWTRTIERPLLQIARETAASILPAVRKKALRHQPATAPYEQFLQGRDLLARRDTAGAIAAFDAAAQSDPEFARALAWAAMAREQFAEQGGARPNDVLPAARDAAERAATLAPESFEAHLALGIVKLQYDWDWDYARREFDRALALSPGHPLALQWRDRWLAAMNRAPAPAADLPNVPHDPDAARKLLAEADDLRSQSYVSPIRFALAATVAQDADSLFHWLDVAYDERSAQLPYLLRNPALPQSDPRLRELIERLKLPLNP